MSFDLSDYIDVAERERQFFERYPEGRIQVDLVDVRRGDGEIGAWMAKATIWRDTEDPIPVIDFAVELVPGKTSYTRDSEAMNASTSAVGRAIILAGFPSKHIASANEMQAREDSGAVVDRRVTGDGGPVRSDAAPGNPAAQAQAAQQANRTVPEDDGKPENVVIPFGKHKGSTLGQVPSGYIDWLIANYEPKTAEQRRLIEAAHMLAGVPPAFSSSDDGIPFGPVPL